VSDTSYLVQPRSLAFLVLPAAAGASIAVKGE
jgi:hypothetical protein